MSLIPYSPREDGSEENIVFRHQRTLVLYDPHKQQLALRDAPDFEPPPVESNNCPYCQRPLRDPSRRSSTHVNNGLPEAGGHVRGEEHGQDEPGFVAPEYFRMLQATLPPPVVINPGRPDSPTKLRRLQQARVDEIEDSPTTDFAELSTPEDSNTSTPRTKISSDAFSPNYFERFFQVERELGRGGNGVVFLVRHELDGVSLGKFACKRVPVGNNHAWLEKVLNEVQLLQQLSHTNLVSYRHVWLEDMVIHKFGPSVPCAFILQQYCNAGDLHNYVLGPEAKMTKEQMKERIRRKSRGQPEPVHLGRRMLEFDEIISFFRDIASGINHLHSKGFIHRDLKPQNCLMNESGVPGSFPKVLVSDFGEVQMETAQRKSTGATGTISYCAPEVLQRVGPNGEYANFTTKSDVFSLGMILYFMCFGRLPYRHSNEEHEELIDIDSLRNEISVWRGLDSREKLRADLPEQLYRSLNKLLSPNPDARPSAEEILRQLEGMGLTEDSIPLRSPHTPSTSRSNGLDDISSPIGYSRISPILEHSPAPASSQGRKSLSPHQAFSSTIVSRSTRQKQTPSPDDDVLTSTAMDRSHSLDSSVVLRQRKNSDAGQVLLAASLPAPPMLTLPWRIRVVRFLRRPELFNIVKLIVFLLKVYTIVRPCTPLAPNPWLHFVVLGVAGLDFVGRFYSLSIMLLVLHFLVVLAASATGRLCIY